MHVVSFKLEVIVVIWVEGILILLAVHGVWCCGIYGRLVKSVLQW